MYLEIELVHVYIYKNVILFYFNSTYLTIDSSHDMNGTHLPIFNQESIMLVVIINNFIITHLFI